MERLGEAREPWELIDSLLRHAHSSLRAVLISRRDIPRGLSALRPSTGAMAAIGDEDLTFTAGEAAQALAEVGKGDADAASVVEATGGWVTGVLFEAWRSAEHVPGMGGEADPLHGYLSAQMLAELCPEDRDFLIETAILHDVNPARAAALGRTDGGERLASLRAAHLPVAWREGQLTMRCHRRFHEYLLELLERLPPERVQALRLAHGRLLADEGLHEEATEELLRADAPAEAFRSARRAIFAVIERVDYPTAERWIATLDPVVPAGAHDWVEAELLLGFTKLEYARSERISDRLRERGEREAVAASSERAAALMGWNYLDAARIEDFKAVLAVAPEGPALAAVKYRAWLTYNVVPGEKPVAPPRTGGPFDSAILIADYLLGRLDSLPESGGSAWALGVATPWRIAMLRARGQTQRAIELYEEAMRSLSVPHSRMLSIFIGPELLVDAGRRDEARAAIAEGRRLAQADGSLSPLALNSFAEAKLALRLEKDPALARTVLDRAESVPNARRIAWAAEMFDTLYGLALLLQGHDEPALARLRLGGGGDAGRRPHPRAADGGGLPGRGRVARRQRGRRRPRRGHRARGRPAPRLQPHPHAGAGRPARGAVAAHRQRAERGLDLAPARPRADRPGRAPDREPGRLDPLQRLRRALARGRRRAAPAEDLQELRAARVPADPRRGHARGAARRALRAAAPTTPRARTCARRSTGCGSACRSGRSSRRRAAPSRSPTTC